MQPIDYFAWLVLIIIVISVVVVFIVLAGLPGKVARQRAHPQADAINVAGWLGIFTVGVVWVLAMIWANMDPVVRSDIPDADDSNDPDALRARIAELQSRLDAREDTPS